MQGIQRCFGWWWWYWGREMERWEKECSGARGPDTVMDHLHAAAAPPRWTHPQNWWATPHVSSFPSSCHIIPPSPSSILHLLISSLSVSQFFLLPFLSSLVLCLCLCGLSQPPPLAHVSLSHNFSLFFYFCVFWLPNPLCVAKSGGRAMEVPYQ